MHTYTFSVRALLTTAWNLFTRHWPVVAGATAATIVAQALPSFFAQGMWLIPDLIGLLIGAFFVPGLMRILLTTVDGGTPQFASLVAEGHAYVQTLFALLLTTLAIAIGFILLILPGIYVSMRLMFVFPLVIDQRLGAIEAMQKSWSLTGGDVLHLLKLWIAVAGLIVAGALLLFIGIFVTAPVALLLLVLAYRQIMPLATHAAIAEQGA
jgi:uncharacterized membrane protein